LANDLTFSFIFAIQVSSGGMKKKLWKKKLFSSSARNKTFSHSFPFFLNKKKFPWLFFLFSVVCQFPPHILLWKDFRMLRFMHEAHSQMFLALCSSKVTRNNNKKVNSLLMCIFHLRANEKKSQELRYEEGIGSQQTKNYRIKVPSTLSTPR
jgi:uncharacterized protein YhhL (DUF1145 family)